MKKVWYDNEQLKYQYNYVNGVGGIRGNTRIMV